MMEHNLDDWKELAHFVNEIPVVDCTPLKWFNSDGNPLSPQELINMGYWGIRPAQIPNQYNPEINKLEEIKLEDCERDNEKKIILRSYKIANLSSREMADLQRSKRNKLLENSDKLVYPDIWEDLPQDRKNLIKSYRKALRDVPQQSEFPENITWPSVFGVYSEDDILGEISDTNSTGISPIEGEA